MIERSANVLAIDPGYSRKSGGCACAEALGGKLTQVWFERPTGPRHGHCDEYGYFDHVFVEQPQQDARSWAIPPAVLIKLAWNGSALAHLYAGATGAVAHSPTVSEWKGSEKKPAHHARLWEVLSDAEQSVLGGLRTANAIDAACEKGALCRWKLPSDQLYPSNFKTHNLLDAAALLMWALGRLEKVG